MRAQHERAHALNSYEHAIWDSENLPFKIHKMLHLPGNLHIEVHQVLRPLQKLHIQVHTVPCLPRKCTGRFYYHVFVGGRPSLLGWRPLLIEAM